MAEINPNVTYAPTFRTVRKVSANDAALPTSRKEGINLADFDEVVVQVLLKNGGTAAVVEAFFWSPEAGAFVPLETPVTITAAGKGVRKVLRVNRSESVFFEVTGIAGGAGERVFVEVAGIPEYDKVG
jgi:hypothetical protein